MSTEERQPDKSDSVLWDQYVESWDEAFAPEGELEWPGDEWGAPKLWDAVHRELFVPAGVEHWRRAVELGPGSGKYTLRALSNPDLTVRGYDVSRRFLEVCEQRCRGAIQEGRLSLHLLESPRPNDLLLDLSEAGWRGEVDGFFSIDALVHVDIHVLMAYLITAGLTLRVGGKLILTLADATSQFGFAKLLTDVWDCYGEPPPGPPGRFGWLAPQIPERILPRIGFRIDHLASAPPESGGRPRDIYMTATLTEREPAARLEKFLFSPPERPRYRVREAVASVWPSASEREAAAAPPESRPGGDRSGAPEGDRTSSSEGNRSAGAPEDRGAA